MSPASAEVNEQHRNLSFIIITQFGLIYCSFPSYSENILHHKDIFFNLLLKVNSLNTSHINLSNGDN